MLILSRKKDQVIRVGEDIEIMVVEIRGDKVRLGIKADRHIPVDREEIWAKKYSAKASAGAGQPDS